MKKTALILFFFTHMAWAGADDMLDALNLEDLMKLNVVSGASKYEQKLSEAPADVTIITAEDIRKGGFRSLYEVLNSVRGLYFVDDRFYNYIGVRGFSRPGDYNSRILMTVNGHRANDSIYDSMGFKGDEPVILGLIEKIEIIRGPASSLYGNNAFFGVINIVTKTGKSSPGAQIMAAQGNWGTTRGEGIYGRSLGEDKNYIFGVAGHYTEGGTRDYPGVGEDDGDWEKTFRSFLGMNLKNTFFQASYFKRNKGVPAAAYGSILGADNNTNDERWFLEASHNMKVKDTTTLSSRLYYDTYKYFASYWYDYPPVTNNIDYSIARFWGTELRITDESFANNKIVFGGEYKSNAEQIQVNMDVDPETEYVNVDKDSEAWALFLQDEWRIRPDFMLSAGVRYDKLSYLEDGKTMPRAALIYSYSEKSTAKLMYGQAFRAPNQYELYFESPAFAQGANSELKPETITTYEAVWTSNLTSNLNLSLTGFYYEVDDLINQTDVGGTLFFLNTNKVKAQGGEAELAFKLGKRWDGKVAYTFQDVEISETGDRLSNSPEGVGKINLGYNVKRGLTVATDMLYQSATDDVNGEEVDGHFVVGLAVVGKDVFTNGFDLSLRVANLFNEEYAVPVGDQFSFTPTVAMPQDEVNGEIKATYRF